MSYLLNKLKYFILVIIVLLFFSCGGSSSKSNQSSSSDDKGEIDISVSGNINCTESGVPDSLCFELSIVDTFIASIVDTFIVNSIVDTSFLGIVKNVAYHSVPGQDTVSILIENIKFGDYYALFLMKDSLYHASVGVTGTRRVRGYYKNPMDSSQLGIISLDSLNPSANVGIHID